MTIIDLPLLPENATAEDWERLFEKMLQEMQLMVAMLEKREIDRHRIPLDS